MSKVWQLNSRPEAPDFNRWENKTGLRIKASGLTDNKKGILPTDLTPNHATSAYTVGDLVLDIATKKFFTITQVYKDGKCDISAAVGTLS